MCDDYPCTEHIEQLKAWPYRDWRGLVAQLQESWHFSDWGFVMSSRSNPIVLKLSTGGWSGNEEIIEALMDNAMFWTLFWESSRRGGHYEFHFPRGQDDKI